MIPLGHAPRYRSSVKHRRARPAVEVDGIAAFADLDAAGFVQQALTLAREVLSDAAVVGHEVVQILGPPEVRIRVVPGRAGAVVLVDAVEREVLPLPPDLTARERQVLQLAAEQKDNAEIAATLELRRSTVRAHLRSCYFKSRARGEGVDDLTGRSRRRSPRERSLDQLLRRAGLTERQACVARLAALGLTNKEIGAALGLSRHTVGPHLTAIYERLRVSRRTELAAALLRLGG